MFSSTPFPLLHHDDNVTWIHVRLKKDKKTPNGHRSLVEPPQVKKVVLRRHHHWFLFFRISTVFYFFSGQ
jgi:hypothetical protein